MPAYHYRCQSCGTRYISEMSSLSNFECHTCGLTGIRLLDSNRIYLNDSSNVVPEQEEPAIMNRKVERQTSHPRPSKGRFF